MGWNSFPFSQNLRTKKQTNKHNNSFTFVAEFTQMSVLFFIADASLKVGKLKR